MRMLVTGGAGFIGSHIADALIEAGHDVFVIDDLSGGFFENVPQAIRRAQRFFLADLATPHITANLVRAIRPDMLWHLAANAREGASFYQPASVVRRNIFAYMNALEPCIAAGVKKVVLFSSMSVYGESQPPFDEDMPTAPVDIYADSKASMERDTRILAACHGFDWVVIRPHNVFGERQSMADPFRNVFGIWMNRILHGEPITIYGDGGQRRAFSYIGDALPWMVRVGMEKSGEIFNVGGLSETTILDAALELQSAWGEPFVMRHEPPRFGEVRDAFPSHEKILRFGFQETVGWREGLRRMAAWARDRGPQEWRFETLPLENDRIPTTWRANHA